MKSATHTVTIARPMADVFAFLADGTRNPDWRKGVLVISRASGTGEVGTTYRQVLAGPGGRRIDGDYRITVTEPPRRLEFAVVAGPLRPTGSYVLHDVPGGTRVTFTLSAEPTGVMKLLGPMIGKQMRAEVAQLDTLKAVLQLTG
ncbi:MAG: hypothetical protein QOI42_536 [Frankiaceae bacterium]|nr:hypothetical protein [Frankiaceae bacterium]